MATTPRGGFRRAGRNAVLAYGMATAKWRPDPDFLIIGAKRCGTTSLFRYLGTHPQIAPLFPAAVHLPLMREDQKGVHYFDTGFAHSDRWYRAHFSSSWARRRLARRVAAPVLTGEASPYYLFHPLAAQRAAARLPHVKLIVLLREPVARTHSHWSEQRRNGVEMLDFEAALDAESTRTAGEEERLAADPDAVSFAHEHQSYVAQSEYANALERWLRQFERKRILVARSEQLYAEPQLVCDRVAAFLDLGRHRLDAPKVWNAAAATEIAAPTRARLEQHFAPHQQQLARLLGEAVNW
jgi:hypothetical protein